MILDLLGYLGAVIVLSTYAYSARKGDMRYFNIGNVVGASLMLGGQIEAGVLYGAIVTASFGCIGAYGLWKNRERI